MNVDGRPWRTIWLAADGETVEIIDQRLLPHQFTVARLSCLADAAQAIRVMQVRGAPLIGATAAYGMALAARDDPSDAALARARETLLATRPTAINLAWALDDQAARLVTGLITERGIAAASREGLLSLYPERRRSRYRAALPAAAARCFSKNAALCASADLVASAL